MNKRGAIVVLMCAAIVTGAVLGRTTVAKGTLSLASARSLRARAVHVADGAVLDLNYKGRMSVQKLSLGGKIQPDGVSRAETCPGFVTGTGELTVRAGK